MSIVLHKGGRIDLTKGTTLRNVRICLGWKPNEFDTGKDFDLDASVFICKDVSGASKLVSDNHFVFYNNLVDPSGAVVHSGDNTDGKGGDEFDEIISIDLTKLPSFVSELSFIVTIHDAIARRQNFGQVAGSVIALFDGDTNVEIAKYVLEDDFSSETAVQFGSIYKKDDNWTFKAVGAGFNRGLEDFVVAYGGKLA